VESGCYLKRPGKRHDIYANLRNGKKAPVPRHTKIKESLCQLIRQMSHTLENVHTLIRKLEVRISDHGYDELSPDKLFVRDIVEGAIEN